MLLHHDLILLLILLRMLRRRRREIVIGYERLGVHAHKLVSGRLRRRRVRLLGSPAGGGGLWRRMELLVRLARRRCGRLWRMRHELQLLRLVLVHAHLHWRVRMRLELLLVRCMAVLD